MHRASPVDSGQRAIAVNNVRLHFDEREEAMANDEGAANASWTKQAVLLTFYQTSWNEMSWRRNAGYRTVILGFAYFGVLLAVVAYNQHMSALIRYCLAGVLALGSLFGAGYLRSNYGKYMAAAKQTVLIEQYVGAYDPSFLGPLGALIPPDRAQRPNVPLSRDPVCLWSVIAFLISGLLTAGAIVAI